MALCSVSKIGLLSGIDSNEITKAYGLMNVFVAFSLMPPGIVPQPSESVSSVIAKGVTVSRPSHPFRFRFCLARAGHCGGRLPMRKARPTETRAVLRVEPPDRMAR